jgi:hypothetical protein
VKGALMLTAKPLRNGPVNSAGVGEINAHAAASLRSAPPSPNAGLASFVKLDASGVQSFDAASWNEVVGNDASWGAASWNDASWGAASWGAASWAELVWSAASWGEGVLADASRGDASWNEASWTDMSSEDAAEGDNAGPAAAMDAAAVSDLQADPDLALPADQAAEDPALSAVPALP